MLKYIVPSFTKLSLIAMFSIALTASFLAGLYGIIHDQVTFSISSEYFTKVKYQQFDYLDFNVNDRLKTSFIGFFATWWVGLFFGWFLARWFLPGNSLTVAHQKIIKSATIIFLVSFLFATISGVYASLYSEIADYSNWQAIANAYGIKDTHAFVNVAYIHNGSYLGALVGFLIALIFVKRKNNSSM